MRGEPWIGVDFDRTLAEYPPINNSVPTEHLGKPVPAMVARVKGWLAEGRKVKIVTARIAQSCWDRAQQKQRIYSWCQEHLGQSLDVTAEKDYDMIELWDDSVVRVERNTGRRLSPSFVEED